MDDYPRSFRQLCFKQEAVFPPPSAHRVAHQISHFGGVIIHVFSSAYIKKCEASPPKRHLHLAV
jgi:hypothetical protein